MRVEKFIKGEAKENLKDNWVKAVLSVFMICFIPLIAALIVDMSYSVICGDEETLTEVFSNSPVSGFFFVIFSIAAVVAVIALSPLMNGFVRFFYSLAVDKKCDVSDLFYFFESKRKYTTAIKLMTAVIVEGALCILACEIPAALALVFSQESRAAYVLGIVLAVLGVITAFIILHKFTFTMILFSYYECDIKKSFVYGSLISKKHSDALIKLSASFIPQILLTYFVVPFVYVYPYMTCSYMISAKYLLEKYQDTYGSIIQSEETESYFGDTEVSMAQQDVSAENAADVNAPYSSESEIKQNDGFYTNDTIKSEQDSLNEKSSVVNLQKEEKTETGDRQGLGTSGGFSAEPDFGETASYESTDTVAVKNPDEKDGYGEFLQFDFPSDDEEITFESFGGQMTDSE